MTDKNAARPRYELLDGLRGVAALMVILYHVGEGAEAGTEDDSYMGHVSDFPTKEISCLFDLFKHSSMVFNNN